MPFDDRFVQLRKHPRHPPHDRRSSAPLALRLRRPPARRTRHRSRPLARHARREVGRLMHAGQRKQAERWVRKLAEGSFAPNAGRPHCRDRCRPLSAIRAARDRLSEIAWLTGAPSSKLSATIPAFCSAVQERRRPAPVKISSRRARAASLDLSLRSEIDMCRSPQSPRLSPRQKRCSQHTAYEESLLAARRTDGKHERRRERRDDGIDPARSPRPRRHGTDCRTRHSRHKVDAVSPQGRDPTQPPLFKPHARGMWRKVAAARPAPL